MNRVLNKRPISNAALAVVEQVRSLPVGTIVTHSQLSSWSGEVHRTNRYSSVIAEARSMLRSEYQVVLKNVIGQGYQVADVEQALRMGANYVKLAHRDLIRSSNVFASINTALATPIQAAKRDFALGRLEVLTASSTSARREISLELGKGTKKPAG